MRIVYEDTTKLILTTVTDDLSRLSTRHPIVEWDEADEAGEMARFDVQGPSSMIEALGLVPMALATDRDVIAAIDAPSGNANQGRFNNGNGALGFRERPGNQKDNRPPGLGPP